MSSRLFVIGAGLLILSASLFAADEHKHWSYHGETGPTHWAELEKENGPCKAGKQQSPIDISAAKKADLPPIAFAYTPSSGEIVNNGHSIQVSPKAGGSIRVGGEEYRLVQFHFHHPSEETFHHKTHPMVAHLVHSNAAGKLAVVAVEIDRGKDNPGLAQIFGAMPSKEGETRTLDGIDASKLLPAGHGYYAFMGSLTTPPCNEGVRWMVLKEPIQVSGEELKTFTKLYPNDARPVQPLNGRPIEVSR
jgi:carbonic anhydrase